MTIIAWDGKTLAADRRATINGTVLSVTKIRKIGDSLVGCAGDLDVAQTMFKWFEDGKDPQKFPECQKDKDKWASMLEISKDGKIFRYEREAYPYLVEEPFFAVGSGMDVALGALSMGGDAVKAVEIASKHLSCCGNGVDTLSLV